MIYCVKSFLEIKINTTGIRTAIKGFFNLVCHYNKCMGCLILVSKTKLKWVEMLFCSKKKLSLLWISFLIILLIFDMSGIDLLLFTSNLSPFLKVGFTLATLSTAGNFPWLKDRLISSVRGILIFFPYFLNIVVVILLGPLALWFFRCLIWDSILSDVMGLIKKDCSIWLFK